ncbi:branched-chain-amino-acid transaminase [Sphingomonas sp.]|uniref:branched-chain-amino-acid transaminase n=1 Tax=Sphingomonas sp. TaxID=28214 RepID=UPI0035B1DD33
MPAPTAALMSLNGRIVPYDQCTVHAFSGVVKYGAAVFEGLRGYWNPERGDMYVFRLREHLERLRYGMRVLRFDTVFDVDFMADSLIAMIRANDLRETVHLRMIAFLDGDDELAATGPVGLVCGAVPRPRSKAVMDGVHVAIGTYARLGDNVLPPRVKCTANYVNNRAAELEAKRNGYNGVLMLTERGKVSEGSGACFFMVRNGVLHTPDTASDILESITRDTVIQLARDAGMAVHERTIDRHEIYAADEAFWCGSGYEVQPIVSLDRLPIGDGTPGPVTRGLRDAYFAAVEGRSEDHPDWRTPVWANA